MPDSKPKVSPIRWALMGDVPAILDGLWRRLEFNLFRPGRYRLDADRIDSDIPFKLRKPGCSTVWVLYCFLTMFIVTGPTVNTFCGLGGASTLSAAKTVLAGLCVPLGMYLFWRYYQAFATRVRWRIGSCPLRLRPSYTTLFDGEPAESANKTRRRVASIALFVIGVLACVPASFLVASLRHKAADPWQCHPTAGTQWSWLACLQLVLVVAISAAGWWVLSLNSRPNKSNTATAPLRHQSLRDFICLVGLWVLAVLLLWAVAPSDAVEANVGPYLHTSWIGIGALMAIAALVYPLAAWRLAKLPLQYVPGGPDSDSLPITSFKDAKSTAPLLKILEDDLPPPTSRGLTAFAMAVGMEPLQTLLLPAFVAIMGPPENLVWYTLGACVFSILMSTYGSLRYRWRQVVNGIQRWFFAGLPLPVSIIVIVLATLRLCKEQYVATILDAAPLGTIFTGIIVCYLNAWFFEIWINRWMAEALLRRLGADDAAVAQGHYEFYAKDPESNKEWHVAQQRAFYIHGPGRIGVQGWQERPPGAESPTVIHGKTHGEPVDREERFSYFAFADLFEQMSQSNEPDKSFLDELRRQLRVYFYSINLLVIVLGLALIHWHLTRSDPLLTREMIEAAAPSPTGVDFAAKLTAGSAPALIVAASGGGTRAALYTAYALNGLSDLGQARNIVLISGVSGGGAAGAAFVDEFDTLTSKPPSDSSYKNAWREYQESVTSPFIADVLDGMDELRFAGSASIGELLAESMQRRLFPLNPTFQSITRADRPALILNSTISGHPIEDATLLYKHAAWDGEGTCKEHLPFGSLAGDRLVYTDLGSNLFAPTHTKASGVGGVQRETPEEDLPDVRFDFKVVNDPSVPLAVAAALNANFPPVFPNARVDIARAPSKTPGPCDTVPQTYYVTDGGATENLGMISALVVLRNTLDAMDSQHWARVRPLYLIAIEASALDYEYSQDRGVAAATGGAKERIADGMTLELIDEVNGLLAAHDRPPLSLHYLSMPLAFRTRGGIGTHWMYAKTYSVSNPLRQTIPSWYHHWRGCGGSPCDETIDHDDIRNLWSSLFDSRGMFCERPLSPVDGAHSASESAATVRAWICGAESGAATDAVHPTDGREPDWLIAAWQETVQKFGAEH